MKRTFYTIILVLMISNTFGQIAIINDPDGWTNVRTKPDAKSQVIHKVFENEVFWCDYSIKDTEQEWVLVYIPKDAFCLDKVDSNLWLDLYTNQGYYLLDL